MRALRSLVKRHSLVAFFVVVFVWSWFWWSGYFAFLPGGIEQAMATNVPLTMLIFVLGGLGPTVASLSLSALSEGRAGLREVWRRLTLWRFAGRWYAYAILIPVSGLLISMGIVYAMGMRWGGNELGAGPFIGLFVGLMAALMEETGWSAYATPRLLQRYGPLHAGALLGVIWGIWHMYPSVWGNAPMGWAYFPLGVLFIVQVTALRMQMTWGMVHAKESAFLGFLMHLSFTGSQALILPALDGTDNVIFNIIFATTIWLMLLAILIITGRWRAPVSPQRPQPA